MEKNRVALTETWFAVIDGRTCQPCELLDGTVWPVHVGPRPPLHEHCRCVRVRNYSLGDEPAPTLRPLDKTGAPLTAAAILAIGVAIAKRRGRDEQIASTARRVAGLTKHRPQPEDDGGNWLQDLSDAGHGLLQQGSDELARQLDIAGAVITGDDPDKDAPRRRRRNRRAAGGGSQV